MLSIRMVPSSRGLLVRMVAIVLAAIPCVPTAGASPIQQAAFVFSRSTVTGTAKRRFHVQPRSASTRQYRAFANTRSKDGGTSRRRPRYVRKCAVASGAVLAAQAADSSYVAEEATVDGGPSAGVWSASPVDPTFRELYTNRLPEWLLARLEDLGFASPTLVQREALEVILGDDKDGEEKNDAVVHAQTGSGKTLAFLLPLFAALDPSRSAVQALVVVPTRELGLQVAGVAKRLAAGTAAAAKASPHGKRIQVMSVLEGSSNKRQRAWASADPPHVVIGNPENLSRLVARGAIRVNAVKYVVVDEVDACLLSEATRASLHDLLARSLSPTHAVEDQAKEEQEEAARLAASGTRITGASLPVVRKLTNRQTVFASATVPQHNHFIEQCVQQQWTLNKPVHVQVHGKEAMPLCLSHYFVVCPPAQKLSVLRALVKRELGSFKAQGSGGLNTETRALVFAHATKPLEQIAEYLHAALGKTDDQEDRAEGDVASSAPLAECLREDLGLNRRADTMALFREGRTRLLVATDMAARGLDVPEISHIFNLDLPMDGEGYVHRGGRAGRLGRPGKVISIITPAQEFAVRRLGNGIGVDIKKIGLGTKPARSVDDLPIGDAGVLNSDAVEDK